MSRSSGGLEYRRLRTPRQHAATLVEPPFAEFAALWARNQAQANPALDIGGRSLGELAATARQALVDVAVRYTRSYRDVELPSGIAAAAERLVLTGHQPELFHPGVWFKNFALDAAARRLQATPINLIIDNDLPHGVAVRCPAVGASRVQIERVPFDARGQVIPFEERAIRDEALFRSFGARLAATIAPWISDPLVRTLWPEVSEAGRRTQRIGLAIAQGRHLCEGRWGLATLEAPLSAVCDSEAFQWFAAHLMREAPRFARDYNLALADYRRLHGVRSRTHPVADLETQDEWFEAPFWIWSEAHPVRRRLFARQRGGCLELSDRGKLRFCLPAPGPSDGRLLEAWQAARQRGLKVRPRALITTLFARMLLGDLFLHGIGGAKYDQLTDEISRRFFGCEPPAFATLTATALLPVPHPEVSDEDVRRVDACLRELQYHPERHAPDTEAARRLAEEKRGWISRPIPPALRPLRHKAVTRINQDFQPLVADLRQRMQQEREHLEEQRRLTALWSSREYAFCLFPEQSLCRLLLDLCATGP